LAAGGERGRMSLAFAFQPVFVYFGFGLSGLLVVARVLLHWALKE
jgi:hypothetical protein